MLNQNVYVGTSPSGVQWIAYAGRHTEEDLARMRERLAKLWSKSTKNGGGK